VRVATGRLGFRCGFGFGLDFGGDRGSCFGAESVTGDLVVALKAGLKPLDHPVLRDRNNRRRSRVKTLANRLEILVLESLVADLAPDAATRGTDSGTGDDARREDQPDEAARDRATLGPLLPR